MENKNTTLNDLEKCLWSFRRKITAVMRKQAEEMKIPTSYFEVLSFVLENQSPTMKDISQYLNITPPSATTIIESMQKKGLIKRISEPKDRRSIKIILTTKGKDFLTKTHKAKFQVLKKLIAKLEDSEQKEFIRLLNKITNN